MDIPASTQLSGSLPNQDKDANTGSGLDNKLILLFDSSGSMREPDASGQTKMDAAKQAFRSLVPKLPDKTSVGLRVYGATVFKKSDPGACSDTQNLVPVGPLDRKAILDEVNGFKPYGETPIAASLRAAAKDLGDSGKRTILLVSDGEETCDPNPCATAKQISGLGIDLKIDVVGFKVDQKAREQLRCITDAGNGTFYNTDDADDLVASMERLAVRAFRPFRVDGEAVQGSTNENADHPVLTAGKYVDTAPALEQTKYYRLERTIEGSTLHVGATVRPAPGDQVNTLQLETRSLDTGSCGYGLGTEVSYANTNPLVTATVSSWSDLTADDEGCTQGDLLLGVRQKGQRSGVENDNLKDVPVELVVIEEPPVDDPGILDVQAADRPRWQPLGGKGGKGGEGGDAEAVVPGASFSDAPDVEPGRYATSLFPGEVQFVRVRLDWGERLQAEARTPEPDAKLSGLIDFPQPLDIRLIAPTRGAAQANVADTVARDQTFLNEEGASLAQASTLDVYYGNRAGIAREQQNAAVAGDYYVAISLGRDEEDESYTVPIELSIGVEGQAGAGAPAYVDGQRLVGPGVENVSGREPGDPRVQPAEQPDGDDAGARADADLPGEGLSPARLTVVLVLSAVVLILIGITAAREILRRRRARTP